MGGWHLRMNAGQEVCYASLHIEPASALGLLTVWSLWRNLGMARCQDMSTLPAGYILHCKVTSASSSGSLGFIVSVKRCRMVDSVPRWQLSLSWPTQSDHLAIGWYCQYIPENQVLVRSWLWKIYILLSRTPPSWIQNPIEAYASYIETLKTFTVNAKQGSNCRQ